MTDRIKCEVPFCKRTRGDRKGDPVVDGMQWVCGDHWRAIPRTLRRTYYRARRLDRGRLAAMCWERCKKTAIERAMGI